MGQDAENNSNMDATPLRLIDVEATINNHTAAGIIFTRCRSWHVISHTWSADVRNLSKIIGKRLASAASMQQSCCSEGPALQAGRHWSYETLFESADFSKESSYKKLLEFLITLRSDDVRWVWFDAVCINQQDKEEKEREIEKMGMYYESSIGCYVIHHGIGRGFEVLLRHDSASDAGEQDVEQAEVLPRWFGRAWTFQEWLLPPRTTFIVDLASEQDLERTAHAILLDECKHDEACSACYFETSLSPMYVRQCLMQQQAYNTRSTAPAASYELGSVDMREDDRDLTSFPTYRTLRCCRPNIHEPHFRKVPNRRNWYFADDLGFAFLIRVKLQMAKVADVDAGDGTLAAAQHDKDFSLSDDEYELTRRLELKGYFRGESDYSITKEKKIRLTIEEMQVRSCSNAEDRVLSVLKLLGVEGMIQVRSKRSLKEQIIHLATTSLRQDDSMVLQLCLVDGFGNETSNMSWAPHFEVKKGSWQAGARLQEMAGSRFDVAAHHFETFKPDARVRDQLSRKGGLQLAASVCVGHLVCSEHQYTARINRQRITAGCQAEPFRRMVLEVEGQAIVYLCARITSAASAGREKYASAADHQYPDIDQYACVLEIVGVETISTGGIACIAFPVPTSTSDEKVSTPQAYLQQLQERIPVWLVKLGVGMHDSSDITYFLVCIGEQTLQQPLHKIGYVGVPSANQSFALSANNPIPCNVAGMGRIGLHEHLFQMARDKARSMCMDRTIICSIN